MSFEHPHRLPNVRLSRLPNLRPHLLRTPKPTHEWKVVRVIWPLLAAQAMLPQHHIEATQTAGVINVKVEATQGD
jgi:hypothetical protein